MKYLLLILQTIVLAGCFASTPEIDSRKVKFSNGQTLTLSKGMKPYLMQEWKRILVVKTMDLFEGYKKEISIYSFDGSKLLDKFGFEGEELIFSSKSLILLAQRSSHRRITKSFLINIDGEVIKEIKQSENIVEINKSSDDQIIWYLSSAIEDGKPVINGKVYDSSGNMFNRFKSDGGERKKILFNQNEYFILIPKADLPG